MSPTKPLSALSSADLKQPILTRDSQSQTTNNKVSCKRLNRNPSMTRTNRSTQVKAILGEHASKYRKVL